MNREKYLFLKTDIHSVIHAHEQQVKKQIQDIPANRLLNASEDDLIQALIAELRLNVPILREDEICVAESGETQVDVSRDRMRMILDRSKPFNVAGNKTVIAVPFDGDEGFFHIRPQSYTLNPPMADIGKGELLLTYIQTDHDANAIKADYQRAVAEIKSHLSSLSESAKQFNVSLPTTLAAELKKRKDRLLADAGVTAALGLPLRKRNGVPTTYSVPVKKRAPRIEELKASTAPFKPEPALATEDYEEILTIMKNMVLVMEQSPHAFQTMGEEDLRSHFLVALNGQFAGQATGETFNFQGKTDILIRVDGKNVFIGECKFWKGEKVFLETLDQLLSYLSWRDTKTSVLIFNRNAGFSAVLAKIAEAVPKHPNFKREVSRSDETTFRYVFGQPNDPNREIILTVLAFDIPTAPASQKTIGSGRSISE